MFQPFPLFIGLRYTRAKKRNYFVSFISLSSILGIALGIMVLITVLSVMNGFDEEIKNRVFSLAPQLTIRSMAGNLDNWPVFMNEQKQVPQIEAAAPFVAGQGMLQGDNSIQPGLILGVDPKLEKRVSKIPEKMSQGQFVDLVPGQFNMILGEQLALSLGVSVNDKITLYTINPTLTPAGIIPRVKRFTVSGIFKTGNGFGFDSQFAFINLHDAQTLFELGDTVTGINFKLTDPYLAPSLTSQLAQNLPPELIIGNWTEQYGALFNAIKLEKTMMFFILLLIITVAAFNLVASLVMVVNDKQSDIAILRTLGATPKSIMKIFIVQGFVVGFSGMLIGLVLGVLLAANVTHLVNAIQHLFHVQLLSSNVYYVDYLPSKIYVSDVLTVCFSAIFLSLLATLYPAWQAAKVEPAEALRYE